MLVAEPSILEKGAVWTIAAMEDPVLMFQKLVQQKPNPRPIFFRLSWLEQ